MHPFSVVSACVFVLGLLAGCSDDDEPGSGPSTDGSPTSSETMSGPATGPSSETATQSMEPGRTIRVGDSEFGPMLFTQDARAIYMWEVEESAEAECYDDCAEAWPPVLTDGEPVAGVGVRAGLLGTTKRTDGTTQVTYGGHPLYLYAHEAPGEVKCHNIATHGGLWWVVRPDGEPAPA